MGLITFILQCIITTLQGLLGFVFLMALIWIFIKIIRPSAQFPRPAVYRPKTYHD